MSIKIIALDSRNKIFIDPSRLEDLREELAPILISNHYDEIYLKDLDIINARYLLFAKKMIDNILPADVKFKITSGFRTIKINNKIGGSKNSQHLRFKALDGIFLFKGNKVVDFKTINSYWFLILDLFADKLIQSFLYKQKGFVHLGFQEFNKIKKIFDMKE